MNPLQPSEDELQTRNEVIQAIHRAVGNAVTIKLPDFDPDGKRPSEYGGSVGPYRYQFEGEEDLLHLNVTRLDEGLLAPEEGQRVAQFLLPGMPPGLVWIRPGEHSQHFFLGHDDLVAHVPT